MILALAFFSALLLLAALGGIDWGWGEACGSLLEKKQDDPGGRNGFQFGIRFN